MYKYLNEILRNHLLLPMGQQHNLLNLWKKIIMSQMVSFKKHYSRHKQAFQQTF